MPVVKQDGDGRGTGCEKVQSMQFVELWRRRKGVPTKAEVQNGRWPKQLEIEREM